MLKKIIIYITIILSVSLLTCDELDDKMLQLRQIEKQIDVIQQKARKAEQSKQKAQKDMTDTQKSKVTVDQAVAVLQKKEAVVQDSLNAINQRVKSNEDKIYDLKELANNEFLRLFYIDTQDRFVAKATADEQLLSMLISSTVKGISDLTDFHRLLVQTQEERRHEYYKVKSSRLKQVKKSEQFKKKIQTLAQQTIKLEKEKQAYEQQVSQLKKDAAELESLIQKLTAASGKKTSNYQFSTARIPWPVRGKIIREFGEESKGNNTTVISNGIDIAVAEGTGVKAVDNGEVVFSDRYGGQGKLLIIDHKNGFFSVYAYNNELLVSKGAMVKKGQVVAKSGKTGTATQPSLHFELRKDGRAVNPMNHLE